MEKYRNPKFILRLILLVITMLIKLFVTVRQKVLYVGKTKQKNISLLFRKWKRMTCSIGANVVFFYTFFQEYVLLIFMFLRRQNKTNPDSSAQTQTKTKDLYR